jgi:chemotaxis protein methyltransferase WspC
VSQAAIEALLQDKIGLDSQTIGSGTVSRAITRRMSDCGLSSLTTYLKQLQGSTKELEALIEEVVVSETWFFRDRKPFDFLSHYLKTEWLANYQNQILRVLSVPCSTGEEPYSIAITLLEAGLTPKNFIINAIDINKKSLLVAQRGVYTQNSFRGGATVLQNQYFTQKGATYQLDKSIINTVNFIHGNLLEPQLLKEDQPYQIIFCRNLLIYLKQSARTEVIQVLSNLLNNQGLLFLGSSETGNILPNNFVPVRHPTTFAFRKETERKLSDFLSKPLTKEANLANVITQQSIKKNKSAKPPFKLIQNEQRTKNSNATVRNSLNFKEKLLTSDPQSSTTNSQSILEIARTLADQGQLDEAASLCETYLSENPINAETHFLLGQVQQAIGNEEQAEQYLQKAIYLKPHYYEALVYLALLKEYHGDQKSAAIIRQRIQRL